MRGGLKVRRERSWDATPLAFIISAIAAYGLTPLVSAVLAGIELLQVDQANESDANLLSRLGREHDAIATIKAGRLLFLPTGKATTASGLALPHVTLTRADGDQHRFLQADRDAYTGVKAYYYDVNSADKKRPSPAPATTSRNCATATPNRPAPCRPPAPSGSAYSVAPPRSATPWPRAAPS